MAKQNEPVRVGVIGCGQVAQRGHLPALRHVREAKVVAVCDLDRELVERTAGRFGVERRYVDAKKLIADRDVEAVAMCLPADIRQDLPLAVLDAGKHLLLEKPLALSLSAADRLIERAEKSSTVSMIGFNMRFHHLLRRARDAVRRGVVGRVRMIEARFGSPPLHRSPDHDWRRWRVRGGGSLVNMAIHHFDLWRFLLSTEVEEVFAATGESGDEVVTVTARLRGGTLGISSVVEETGSRYDVEILGEKGRLDVSCYRFDGYRHTPIGTAPGDIRTRVKEVADTLAELPRALLRPGLSSDYALTFRDEWRHFVDCIRNGRSPECTLTEGRRALEIVIAACCATTQGRFVRMGEIPDCILPTTSG